MIIIVTACRLLGATCAPDACTTIDWSSFADRPDDPTLSCFMHANETWSCAPDFELYMDDS